MICGTKTIFKSANLIINTIIIIKTSCVLTLKSCVLRNVYKVIKKTGKRAKVTEQIRKMEKN